MASEFTVIMIMLILIMLDSRVDEKSLRVKLTTLFLQTCAQAWFYTCRARNTLPDIANTKGIP